MIEKQERIEMPQETNHGLLLYKQINDQTKTFKSLIKMLQWEENLLAPFSLNSCHG